MKNIIQGHHYRYTHGDFIDHESIKDIDMYNKLSDMFSLKKNIIQF